MRPFLLGAVTAVVLLVLGAFLWVRFGFVDPRADIPINALEEKIAMPSLDASVDRRAPEIKNPLSSTGETLVAGMKIYQAKCADCHGDIGRPHGTFADALYPRAPQFMDEAPDMPENQNFYIIQHGIRLSGMPAWKQSLSEEQIWQVTAFLGRMDKLPSSVVEQWKAAAGEPSQQDTRSSSSPQKMNGMNMNQ